MTAEGVEGLVIEGCLFDRLDGNAVSLNGAAPSCNRHVTVSSTGSAATACRSTVRHCHLTVM